MSEEEEKPVHIQYRSLQTGEREWSVFVIDDREPDWWRVVAKFANQGRADDYASMENTFLDDEWDTPLAGREDSLERPPQLEVPASALTHIIRRESVSHTRIEREETVSLPAPAREEVVPPAPRIEPPSEAIVNDKAAQISEVAAEVDEVAPQVDEPEPLLPPVDCITLAPLTPTEGKCLFALRAAIKECGGRPPYSAIARHAGLSGVAAFLPNLEAKGYVKNFGEYGAPDWRPTFDGDPVIEVAKDSRGKPVRQWTAEEVDGLQDLSPALGDDYAKYAAQIDRTLDAVMQKARTERCFQSNLVPGYAKAAPAVPPKEAQPSVLPPPVSAPKPVKLDDKPVMRVVRRLADQPAAERNMTSELMGDPKRGRSAADKAEFDVRSYLVRKGHTVCMAGITWVIDGRNHSTHEVLDIVNGHRAKADLSPLTIDAIP